MSDDSVGTINSNNLHAVASEQILQHINYKVNLLQNASLFGAYGAVVIAIFTFILCATHMVTGNYMPSEYSKHEGHMFNFKIWCDWDLAMMLLSIVGFTATIFLILGLKKDKNLFINIWLIVFTTLVVIDVIAEFVIIIINGIEPEIRHGRFVFFVIVDSYVYLQLILYSYYRSLKKEREQLLNEIGQVSRTTMIRVNQRLRESIHRAQRRPT